MASTLGRGMSADVLPLGFAVLNGAWMPSMAEDVAIVTRAACARLAGVDKCGLLRDRAAIRGSYQSRRYGPAHVEMSRLCWNGARTHWRTGNEGSGSFQSQKPGFACVDGGHAARRRTGSQDRDPDRYRHRGGEGRQSGADHRRPVAQMSARNFKEVGA